MAKRPVQPDCYDYVRNYYHVPAHAGTRVKVGNKEGVIVRKSGSQQYIFVRFDGVKHDVPCHPTDGVEYLEPSQPAA
jgi:hypothetical protein